MNILYIPADALVEGHCCRDSTLQQMLWWTNSDHIQHTLKWNDHHQHDQVNIVECFLLVE